jgi:hypothetical protein
VRPTAVVALCTIVAGCGGASGAAVDPVEPGAPPPPIAVALRFVEAPDDATGTPQTRILLVEIDPDRGRSTIEIGTFAGACNAAEPAEGELLRGRCWWGGTGAEVRVRRDADELVVERLDDEEGSGQVTEVTRIRLPDEARVEPLGSPALERYAAPE